MCILPKSYYHQHPEQYYWWYQGVVTLMCVWEEVRMGDRCATVAPIALNLQNWEISINSWRMFYKWIYHINEWAMLSGTANVSIFDIFASIYLLATSRTGLISWFTCYLYIFTLFRRFSGSRYPMSGWSLLWWLETHTHTNFWALFLFAPNIVISFHHEAEKRDKQTNLTNFCVLKAVALHQIPCVH